MKWLLDTNVVSETTRRRPSQLVLDWIERQPADQLALSVVTHAELMDGVSSTPDEQRRHALREWLDTAVSDTFGDRILPLSVPVLLDWLQLSRRLASRRITRQAPDLLIAATARVHDLILVSRNLTDFAGTGVLLFDPWNDRHHQMDQP